MLTHLVDIPFSEMPHAMFSHETHLGITGKKRKQKSIDFYTAQYPWPWA
jgi:hypothetical protein